MEVTTVEELSIPLAAKKGNKSSASSEQCREEMGMVLGSNGGLGGAELTEMKENLGREDVRVSSPPLTQGLSFITFVCYVASSASAFLTAPLLEFLLALFFLFADAMQLNDKWQGLCWPMMDFLRCVTAALIYFAISITAVAKYSDGASKAAGVFGFFATIVFAVDFYLIFNDVAKFLKQGGSADETTANKEEEENSDSDSD
ncbi:PREDICTED: CKLF-like MARVEL transmembrane domain-containing protein 3 [Miniopterus natalensis]|uniref:CKLF-like MARVEL transmembrane domain-containing protein 3 n=1 Tax=Miniopterus natalensis TaxID=291302 RepID=UPI0007A6EA52|nr:PREDICTED: CKLF-like MARVEL transmembrane domain-containing protein 3 [Miniopterus natalensis]